MALTRLYAWATGSVPTSTNFTGEFDNIYNNALTLISPLTADLAFGGFRATGLSAGTVGSPALQFTGNTNTGIYSPASNQVAIAVAGVAAANFTAAAAGPHAIGGATRVETSLSILGSFTPTGVNPAYGMLVFQSLTPAANNAAFGINLSPGTFQIASSGTHADFASLKIDAPTIGAGVGTLTNASTLKISSVPTGATNNYPLWVAAGSSRYDGQIFGGTTLQLASLTGNAMLFGRVASVVPGAFTEDMRLSAGILLLATTVTTGATAGELVLANANSIRNINAAGTSSLSLIRLSGAGNNVQIAADGGDIQWGRALVALGAGGAATLGNTGGSGPATTTQNTWMRVLDSAGAAFWVPAWK